MAIAGGEVGKDDLRKYARLGAEARLAEIAEEARQILAAFPDLHRSDLTDEALVHGRSLHDILPGDRRRGPRTPAGRRKAVRHATGSSRRGRNT
jgi:hypothetical protein